MKSRYTPLTELMNSVTISMITDSGLDLDDNQIEIIEYSLRTIINESGKFILMLMFFTFIGLPKYYLALSFFSSLYRINMGGFHVKGFLNCMILSLLYYSSIIFLSHYLIGNKVLIFFGIIFALFVFQNAPFIPTERLDCGFLYKNKLKKRCRILTFIYLVIPIIYPTIYTTIPPLVIIEQALIQLTYMTLKRIGVINHETFTQEKS